MPKTWVEPTAKTLEKFFPEKGEDIDYIEEVHETVTMEVYCAKFFKQCEKRLASMQSHLGWICESDAAFSWSGGIRAMLASKDETGAIAGGLQ